jgi:hypothetical protein
MAHGLLSDEACDRFIEACWNLDKTTDLANFLPVISAEPAASSTKSPLGHRKKSIGDKASARFRRKSRAGAFVFRDGVRSPSQKWPLERRAKSDDPGRSFAREPSGAEKLKALRISC